MAMDKHRQHRLHVIATDIEPGETYEIRHVKPGEIVLSNGDIDWEKTPYRSVVLRVGELDWYVEDSD